MATSALNSLWGNLWTSHRETKRLLTLSRIRQSVGHTPTAADEDKTSPAPAQDATKGPGSPQSPGNPGPGYTPARLTGLILGPALFVAAMLFFNPAGLSPEGQAVLAVTLWVATWWITEAIPIPVTSLLAVVYQAAHTLRGGEHAAELPKFEKSIVFGIGYAATIGGLGTLIGTPPLAILAATTGELFGETISFGQWMMFGVPIVILLLAFTWFFLTNVSFKVRFKHLPGGAELIRSEKKALGAMSHEEKAVLAVFLGVAFLWVTRSFIWEDVLPGISDGIIAIIATVVLFTLPTRRADERRIMQWEDSKKIPWGILLLFGGGLAIAAGFVETGLSGWIGEQLRALDGVDVILIILLATALVLFMTEITSNAATATMILPVMAAFAIALGIHPFALMVPCAMAANCAFMLPVGTPPNAILFGTGKVTIMEMVKTGFWLNIAALLLIVAAVLYVLPSLWGIDLMSTPAAFQ